MRVMQSLRTILWVLLILTVVPSPVKSQQVRPSVQESFGVGELTLTGGAILGLGVLSMWGGKWIGPNAASMGRPLEGSTDLRFSRWANPDFDPQTQWLGGVPDLGGYLAPALGLGYYIGGSLIGGKSGYYGAYRHEAIAFTEALSWSMLTTVLLKRLVGRERPYVARGHWGEIDASAVKMNHSEQLLSFPSGHSTAIAATTFFMAADLSDALITGPLRESTSWNRALIGRVIPYVGASTLSWIVMYSRIKDQRHWLSDTLVGTAIGGISALLSYHLHFDRHGQPYRR